MTRPSNVKFMLWGLLMSKDRVDIINEARQKHDDLSKKYYSDPENYPGGKVQFDMDHTLIWVQLQVDLIDNGYQDEVLP